jgi:hypothetical protein
MKKKIYLLLELVLCQTIIWPSSFDVYYQNAFKGLRVVRASAGPQFWDGRTVEARAQEVSQEFCKSGFVTTVLLFSDKKDFGRLNSLNSIPSNFHSELAISELLARQKQTQAFDLLCEGLVVVRARDLNKGKVKEYAAQGTGKMWPFYANSLVAIRISYERGADGEGKPLTGANVDFFVRTIEKPSTGDCKQMVTTLSEHLEGASIWLFLRKDGEFSESLGPSFDIFAPWPDSALRYVERHNNRALVDKTVGCIFDKSNKNPIRYTK